ncbi:SYK [Cordylochernes scorpioides]|uniref:SYK n=1 Tax=Cordylochernes scorpioides TaxID=51811 RepID=A0ABY6LW65_9ARAC|nr:SYK [Cordylochernes scorpioides]
MQKTSSFDIIPAFLSFFLAGDSEDKSRKHRENGSHGSDTVPRSTPVPAPRLSLSRRQVVYANHDSNTSSSQGQLRSPSAKAPHQIAYSFDSKHIANSHRSVRESFQEKPPKKTTAIFLDMTSAFDRVWREKLREKLHNIGSYQKTKHSEKVMWNKLGSKTQNSQNKIYHLNKADNGICNTGLGSLKLITKMCLGMVLDSLLAQRLKHWLESNELLSSFQHGFREGKSTTTALNEVLEGVEMGLNKGAWVLFVALDMDGGFNSMSWNKLMRNLMDMGCPDNLCSLVRDFLRDRRISLSFGGRKLERNCARGCPQGSCCGTILWNILVNTVFQEELPEGARLVLYADDQFLIIEAASRAKAEKCVGTSLQILSIWAHDSGLKFNVSKTKALSFKPRDMRTKRKGIKWEHKPAIRMEGQRVALVNRMTILGVVIDDKMGWQYQVEEMVARGREALCRPVLVGSQQGGREKEGTIFRNLCLSCVEPILLYASGAWWRRNRDQKVATTLERVQRTAALRITGGYRTTSSEAFLVLAGIIPLGLKLEEETIRHQRTGKMPWDLKRGPWNRRGIQESLRSGCQSGIGVLEGRQGLARRFSLIVVSLEPILELGVVIFTNGELIFQESLTLRVDELVFSAELVAIRVALRVCAEKNFSPDCLYSDCMSALVAINLEKGQLAHQIIQELEMMTRAPELPWFRRHSLIEGNEFADRIAKAGCFRGRSLRTPVTKKEVYRRIRGHVQDLWLDRWRNSVKGREVFNGGNNTQVPLLHRFKIKINPDCVYGERDVNARHYVLDCPRVVGVQEERRRARGAIESKLLRNHSKLLEKAHDVEAELFLSCTGNFGEVVEGVLTTGNVDVSFAVKKFNIKSLPVQKNEILKEARVLATLDHPHIVRLVGTCEDEETVMLVLELAPLGTCQAYLRAHPEVGLRSILGLMLQVAQAMEYLESRQLVHRDLSLRNVLLVNEDFAKVSDFGLARPLAPSKDYYRAEVAGKWPLRWYAPECIYYYKFSSKSDVWSFGITLWEAVSHGGRPYQVLPCSLSL